MGTAEIESFACVLMDVLRGCGVHVHPADGVSLNSGRRFGCAHVVRRCAVWLANYAVRYPMLYIGFIRRSTVGNSTSYRRALANDLSRRGFQLRCAAGRARTAGDRQHAGGLRNSPRAFQSQRKNGTCGIRCFSTEAGRRGQTFTERGNRCETAGRPGIEPAESQRFAGALFGTEFSTPKNKLSSQGELLFRGKD